MSRNHSRRLQALEARRVEHEDAVAKERDHFEWLSMPSVVTVARQFARMRAERRWCYDHGRETHRIVGLRNIDMGPEYGWRHFTTPDERDDLTMAELHRIKERHKSGSFFTDLEQWCDDNEGLADDWQQWDATSFRTHLRRDRRSRDWHRSQPTPLAIEWRKQHPEWRPDMTDDEYDEWETLLFMRKIEDDTK